MQLLEAKKQFVQAWVALGSQWGINKTMAQIHALMMVSTEPLSTEEIMEELSISRGNANMNIRELTDWGLVTKVFKAGERRDYFVGEEEVWKIAKQVAKIRKTRELDPILKLLEQLKTVNAHIKNDELKHFQKMVNDVHKLAVNVDRLIESIFKAEESWFWDKILKIFTK